MSEPSRLRRHWWVMSLAAALAFLVADSAVRLRGIRALTEGTPGSTRVLTEDPATPSGYEGNQHRVVVPLIGIDGYHWAMQTQQMIADGTPRVRHVDYDGPPEGRAVHWSSVLRWSAAVFAWITSKVTGTPLALAVEAVYPWVNTVLLGILLVVLVPIVARRFGALPASLLAGGAVALYPIYEFFAAGNFDHQGLATFAVMGSVLCLIGGGAGWVRDASSSPARAQAGDRATLAWLPDIAQARRWFVASGVVGGAGLWISAATQIPTLIGVGLAAFMTTGVLARRMKDGAAWRVEPALWRAWGIAGAASSLAFYLLEYFPSHMTLRLEVNHPLHALAWFGAGDLLFRLCTISVAGNGDANTTPASSRAPRAAWIAIDVMLIALVPVVAALVPDSFVLRPGSLVMSLHEDYIEEFQSLPRQLAGWSWLQINAGVGLLPLVTIGPAMAAALTKRIVEPLRALAIVGLVPALLFTGLAFRHGRWLNLGCALSLCTIVALATIARIGRHDASGARAVRNALLGIALSLPLVVVPILVYYSRQGGQPVLSAIIAAAVAAASTLPALGLIERWNPLRLVSAGALLGLAFAPFPAVSIYRWSVWHGTYPAGTSDLAELVTRDVSYKLRARLGPERGVVASGPTTATWMTYFGGVKSTGTLYWENRDGLAESARLFGATSADSGPTADAIAYQTIKRLGVTHIVLFSWNAFVTEYARLALGIRAADATAPVVAKATEKAFGPELLQGALPLWARPLPYPAPTIAGFDSPWVLVLEVAPGQTPAEATTRYAQYCLAMNDEETAVQQLLIALATKPDYQPALISLARVQLANPKRGDYRATLQRLRAAPRGDSLALEDNIGLASLLMATGDTAGSRSAVLRAISQADEQSVRHLPWDYTGANFLILIQQFKLADLRPALVPMVFGLLDPAVQAQLTGTARRQ